VTGRAVPAVEVIVLAKHLEEVVRLVDGTPKKRYNRIRRCNTEKR
jgi:hypothetical protein